MSSTPPQPHDADDPEPSPYVRGFAVVEFDVDVGQTTRVMFPPGCLTGEESAKLAFLSLPDSNTSTLRDVVYSFRMRSDIMPLFASSTLDHTFSFACAYFRQRRDATQRRGFVQHSVAVVSYTPYVGLLKQIARVVGYHYLEADEANRRARARGATVAPAGISASSPAAVSPAAEETLDPLLVLKAAMEEINRWPPPIPGTELELPLLGSLLTFRVPWTGLHAYKSLLRREPHAQTRRPSAFDFGAAAGAAVKAVAAEADATHSAAPTSTAAGSAGAAGSSAADATLLRAPSSSGSSLRRYSNVSETHDEDRERAARRPVSTGVPLPPGQLSLGDVFAAKNQEMPGMFQEIGLFSVFRSMVPCLWHLWELALTGQPVLVMGASPEICGDAVLGIVSLISPLDYCADFRPYFTLYDPDFAQITRLAGALWGTHSRSPKLPAASDRRLGLHASPTHSIASIGSAASGPATAASSATNSPSQGGRSSPALPPPMLTAMAGANFDQRALTVQTSPPILIGTTNPFFSKALERWPNALWLGGMHGSPATAVSGVRSGSARAGAAAPRSSSAPRPHGSSDSAVGEDVEPVALRTSPRTNSRGGLLSLGTPSRGYSTTDAKIKAVSAAASLVDVLPAPGQEATTDPVFVIRQGANISADATVLSSLLRVRATDEEGVQLRLGAVTPSKPPPHPPASPRSPAGFKAGIAFQGPDPATGGEIPAVVINNAILRQHFRQLTTSFLKPFERYFVYDPAFASQAATSAKPAAVRGPFGAGQPIPFGADDPASAQAPGQSSPTPAQPEATVSNSAAAAEVQKARTPSGRFRRVTPGRVLPAELLSAGLAATQSSAPNTTPDTSPPPAAARALSMELHSHPPDSPVHSPAPIGAVPAQFGPYDDLPALCLPRFDEGSFLRRLEQEGGPKHRLLRQSNWRALYTAFIHSPHFYPWCNARRREASRSLFEIARRLRINTSRDELLVGLGLAGGVYANMAWSMDGTPTSAVPQLGVPTGSHAGDLAGDAPPPPLATLAPRPPGPPPRIVGRGSPHAMAIAAGHARGLTTSPLLIAAPAGSSGASAMSPPLASSVPLPAVGSPPREGSPPLAAPTLRRITSTQLHQHEAAVVELHNKIVACFVRETPFLQDDTALTAVMRDHLRAVESVMPPRILAARSYVRQMAGIADAMDTPSAT